MVTKDLYCMYLAQVIYHLVHIDCVFYCLCDMNLNSTIWLFCILLFVWHELELNNPVCYPSCLRWLMCLSTCVKVERLINCIVVDHEEQLSSVLVLLEPVPDTAAFDAARQVCHRLHNMKGPPTIRQVFYLRCILILTPWLQSISQDHSDILF